MGVGCPCPPIRNDNVTPRHLFSALKYFMIVLREKWQGKKDVLHFFDLNKPAADGFWSLRVMKLRILFQFTHINMRSYCDWGSDNFGQFLLSVIHT